MEDVLRGEQQWELLTPAVDLGMQQGILLPVEV